MEEKNITAEESLLIIQSMINNTKKKLADNSAIYFMWGIAVVVCSIVQYILIKTGIEKNWIVWYCMPILGIINGIYFSRKKKKITVENNTTQILKWLWIILSLACCIVFVFCITGLNGNIIIAVFLILYAVGITTTGAILELKAMRNCGLLCMGFAFISFYIHTAEVLLVFALAAIVSYILPAFIIKNAFKNQQI